MTIMFQFYDQVDRSNAGVLSLYTATQMCGVLYEAIKISDVNFGHLLFEKVLDVDTEVNGMKNSKSTRSIGGLQIIRCTMTSLPRAPDVLDTFVLSRYSGSPGLNHLDTHFLQEFAFFEANRTEESGIMQAYPRKQRILFKNKSDLSIK